MILQQIGSKRAALAASATLAIALGAFANPQEAKADICVLVDYPALTYVPTFTETAPPNDTSTLTCGTNSTTTGPNATTLGSNTSAGQNGTAIGANASVSGVNSVALGQGSTDGGQANVVSVGAVGSERKIVNVAAGTNGTDAVNFAQLTSVAGSVATALRNSNTALSTANAASAAVTAQASSIAAIQVLDVQQSTAISALQASQGATSTQIFTNNRNANGGIAAAMAMGGTIMPADAKFAVSFNLATYRGEQGFSGAATVRVSNHVYISGGFAGSTVKGSTGARAGMTLAW